jgi:hypothetical protein
MTLPLNPYIQILDLNYVVFQEVLAKVRRARLLGFQMRKKLIILGNSHFESLRQHFAWDLVCKDGMELHKYIRMHYGFSWLERIWWLKHIPHPTGVTLRWKVLNGAHEEYLLVQKEVGLLYGGGSGTGNGGEANKITLDLTTDKDTRYILDDNWTDSFETRKFFRKIVSGNGFYRECAEFTLLKQENGQCSDYPGVETRLIEKRKLHNWETQIKDCQNKDKTDWEKKLKRVTSRW